MGYLDSLLRRMTATLRDRGRSEAKKVHALRVGTKQLRSVWRLARMQVGRQSYRVHNAQLRDLARAVGPQRDHAVICKALRKISAPAAIAPKSPGPTLKLVRTDRVLDQFGENVATLKATSLKRKLISRALERSMRKVARHRRRCQRRNASSLQFHEWRKRSKDLMYQLEFAAEAGIKVNQSQIRDLKRLTGHLGKAHDFDMLCDYLRKTDPDRTLVRRAEKLRRRFERKSLQDRFPV